MKRIFIFVAILGLVACNKEIPVIDPNESVDPKIITSMIDVASTEWGATKERILSGMKGCTLVTGTDKDISLYTIPNSQQYISYLFKDGRLMATDIIFPNNDETADYHSILTNYSYLGIIDNSIVYINDKKNTLASVWSLVDDDIHYSIIGFAPIVSDLYEAAQPIGVRTDKEYEAGSITAIVYGTVSGVDDAVEVGAIYGLTPDLSVESGTKVSTTSQGKYSVELKGLMDDELFYYCAYAIIDEMLYLGDLKAIKTKPLVYYIDGKPFRMVRVDNGSSSFSIMQTELPPKGTMSIENSSADYLDRNQDDVVTKAELRIFMRNLRAATGLNFRLPTPAEWKLAAKGGSFSNNYNYSGSNNVENVAWYSANSNGSVQGIALKEPNELGLYDMSGNYGEIVTRATKDIESEDAYVDVDGDLYGGCWNDAASNCTVTSWMSGSTSGKIHSSTGSYLNEYNAVDGRYYTIRLVYTRPNKESGNEPSQINTVPVTSISLDESTLSLNVGDSYWLNATLLPIDASNQSVDWRSSSPDVASVSSNGFVKAIKSGVTTITVRSIDGNHSADCQVIVSNVPVSGVSLNLHEYTMDSGTELQLKATVSPDNATIKTVKWSSDSASASVSDEGLVKAISGGSAVITVKTDDGDFEDECVITINKVLKGTRNGHDWVDLELPSGVKWATCNVGASSPEKPGNYYAWGDIKTRSLYDWSTYLWCNKSAYKLTKYNTMSNCGTVDNKTRLDLSDDVAHATWGDNWRMPTDDELMELMSVFYCTWKWTSKSGVNGFEITSIKNGEKIFLPAAGIKNSSSVYSQGTHGFYWSSDIVEHLPYDANSMVFYESSHSSAYSNRYEGQSIRPVIK